MGMREAYIEKVTAQLVEWQTWIERYKIDATSPRSGWPVNPSRMLQRLEDSYQSACFHLENLNTSHDSGWDNSKDEVEQAMIGLKMALDESGAGRAGHSLALHSSRAHMFAPFPRKE